MKHRSVDKEQTKKVVMNSTDCLCFENGNVKCSAYFIYIKIHCFVTAVSCNSHGLNPCIYDATQLTLSWYRSAQLREGAQISIEGCYVDNRCRKYHHARILGSEAPFEKPTISQLMNRLRAIYGIQHFIIVFIRADH